MTQLEQFRNAEKALLRLNPKRLGRHRMHQSGLMCAAGAFLVAKGLGPEGSAYTPHDLETALETALTSTYNDDQNYGLGLYPGKIMEVNDRFVGTNEARYEYVLGWVRRHIKRLSR